MQENPDNYDIEVLSGKESEYIEMVILFRPLLLKSVIFTDFYLLMIYLFSGSDAGSC